MADTDDTASAVSSYLNPQQDLPAVAAKASMSVALDANPDYEAELRRASARVGVPIDSARAFPEDVKRTAALESHDFDEMAKQFPATTRFLGNPENARVSHDDVPNLNKLEATIGPIQGPRASVSSVASGLLTSFVGGADMARQGIRAQFADLFDTLGLFSPESNAQMRGDALGKYAYRGLQRDTTTPEFQSSTASGVYSGGASTLRMLPALAAAVATRSTAPLLAVAGAQTEAEAYGKYRLRGGTAGEALAGGVAEGAIEVVTEKLPMSFLVNNLGKTGAGHFITGLLAREIPGEQLATLGQDAVDTAIANPDKTWEQYAAERGDAAYQTLLATVTQTALMGGASSGIRTVQQRSQQAQMAAQMGDALLQFNDVASASKVRERDTATAESFFQSLMQEGRGDVFITPKALAESGLLEQIAAAMPDVATQMQTAAQTGADVRLPIAQLMANFAGPEIAQSIIPHLSEEPGGFTPTTANEYMQSGAAKELADHITRTLGAKAQYQQFNASRDVVAGQVLEQLNTAGRFAPQVNQAYASMVGNFYAVQAAKLGISPEEMAARYPLQVRAERMAGAKTLDQAPVPQIETRVTTDAIERSEDDQFMLDFATPKEANDTTIRAVIDGKEVGYLDLAVGADGKTANVREVKVDKAHRRKGVATALYNAARAQGFEVAQSEHQTTEGKAFRAAYDHNTVAQSQKTIEVDGKRRPITNSKGQLVGQNFAEQKAFWEWFGDSKVVDEQGRPLVVYHGTTQDIEAFDGNKATEKDAGWYGRGIYFTADPSTASAYSGFEGMQGKELSGAPRVMPAYMALQNAYVWPENKVAFTSPEESTTFTESLIADGYDGVIVPNKYADPEFSGHYEVVAFEPTQIKSATGNDGTFDANDPSILSQGERGSLSFADDITTAPSVITLLANADLSTFLHESGHFFLEVMNDIASRPDAPAEIRADMDAMLNWFGVPDLATWDSYDIEQKRQYHEQFARGFEAYLFEGNAPTAELQGLFSRFRSWLVNVYKSLTALDVELTPEVRGVFDRMLASAEAIEQAEQEGGFAGLFTSKPEFMTDEDWAAYRDLTVNAAQDAAHALETRSLRDMQWLSNAKAKLLAKMQRAAKDKRTAVRAEVEAEVMAEPINQARAFLKRGVNPDGAPATNNKMSIDSMIEMFGGDGDKYARLDWSPLGYGKYGMLAKEGLTPDMVAELFGLQSGEIMVRDLLAGEQPEAKIEGLTDQRMLEQYGDLIDEQSIDRAINEALHSGAHARFVATELAALNKAAGNRAILNKAAKTFAEATVARVAVKDLRPELYSSAARRAAKAAEAAFKKGDIQTAAAEKQTQLINTYAAKAALDAQERVSKTLDRFNQIANGKDDLVGKTRDMDMVHATRAILAEFGVGRKGKKATEYLATVAANDPGLAEVLRARIDSATENAAPFATLTVEQVQALSDEVESMWYLAKRSRQMEVDGDLMDRQDVQEQLRARLEEIGIPDRVPGEGRAVTPGEAKLTSMQTLRSALRRVESWAGAKDGNDAMGPFRKFIWNTIKDPADAYRADKAKYLKRYRLLLEPIAKSLKKVKIAAPELGYEFGWDNGSMGKVEILHAILHTGNESNMRKLLLGRPGWGGLNADGTLDTSKWDKFINRMIAEGVVTKADFDFAQGVWDLLEDMKPLAQKAHREAFGRYFDEVTANSFETPFGTYRGGYVPAMADSRVNMDAKLRELVEHENETMINALPSTSKGFTKSRVESNRELLLDLRSLSRHIDKVLLFSHMEGPVRDVTRILKSKTVAYPLDRVDPTALGGLLNPWLSRTARQQVETPISATNGLMRFFSVARQRAGMAAMFANVSNTAQQITGFSIALLKVKPHYLMSSTAEFFTNPAKMAGAVAEASPYMANRMLNEVGAMTGVIDDILLNPGVYDSAKAWTAKHTYFMQAAVDNVMGPIIWTGAYNQAMETAPAGMTDEQLKTYARRLADSAVRETQGSTLPEDISRIETGNAAARIFTQFAGYFNMQANILGTEFAKVAQETGLRKGAGRGFYVMMFGFLAPAWVATAIAVAFRGGPDDEDKDGSYIDDWFAQVVGWGTLRSATAMIPFVGTTVNAAANGFNGKPYDDRISTAPAISMIESAASVPSDVYKLSTGTGSATKTVRDVATLISLTVGVPANALARPLTFAVDVETGKARPTGKVDVARGLITGTSSPASKGR